MTLHLLNRSARGARTRLTIPGSPGRGPGREGQDRSARVEGPPPSDLDDLEPDGPAAAETGASPGSELSGPGTIDHVAAFRPAIVNVRWATTAVALVLAARRFVELDLAVILASIAVLAYTIYRTVLHLRYTGSSADQGFLVLEIGLFWSAAAITGFWASPLVILMSSSLIISGFAGGFRLALRVGATVAIAMSVCNYALGDWSLDRMTQAVQWTTILLLTGVIAGYTRRISGEASARHSAALDRMSQLSDANNLLFNLHRLAQTLPASLDQSEVLESTLSKLRGLLPFDRAVILLVEETDQTWTVAQQQALGLTGTLQPTEFPWTARQAAADWRIETTSGMPDGQRGFHPESDSGMYAPLIARDRLIGLLAIESHHENLYGEQDAQTLRSFIEPVALAIDNARWFGRLRRVSVDEERSRIARELHDRIGQSLACLGFDADRTLRLYRSDSEIDGDLESLRDGVRAVTGEIRDALYDLRADVAEDKSFELTMGEFADRVMTRSDLQINLDFEAFARLPILQEREMWRIAQEAMVNVERHAAASTIQVTWRCDDQQAALEVADDGRGMTIDRAGRVDSYGIVGMRERANSIGASFEINSKPGEGTKVRCYLNQT